MHFIQGFDCYGTTIEDLALSDTSAEEIQKLNLSLNKTEIDKLQNTPEESKEILKKRAQIREYAKSSILSHV